MQETEETLEKITMKQTHSYLRFFIQLAASLLAVYVGGWLMMAQPVIAIYHAICTGTLGISFLLISIFKIFLSTTVIGAIWCTGYIVAGYFKEYEDE